MVWRNRPSTEPEQRFDEIEKELGLQNLTDVQVDAENGYLYIYTESKKFRITMTEV